jgi:hypothetical protein
MKIVEDLGMTTASENTTALGRYALFECTTCKTAFKARCGSTTAMKQTQCKACANTSHQQCHHPLYAIWNGIKQRCYSPKRKDFERYGGIGVTMSDVWVNDVNAFITWCLANGWSKDLVVDKDILCELYGISPAIYSPETISFITTQQNAEFANAKEVIQYTLDMQEVARFRSAAKAAVHMNVVKSTIANACRGIQQTAKGFIWKYA